MTKNEEQELLSMHCLKMMRYCKANGAPTLNGSMVTPKLKVFYTKTLPRQLTMGAYWEKLEGASYGNKILDEDTRVNFFIRLDHLYRMVI